MIRRLTMPSSEATAMPSISLDDLAYVEKARAMWRSQPIGMNVVEYYGNGDPFFGGNADDRPLGTNGQIIDRGSNEPRAVFTTIEEAHSAARAIPNRRPGSILGVIPWWR